MAGFNNDVVYGVNVDFTTTGLGSGTGTILANGQMLIGTTALNVGGTHINVGTLTSPDSSITIGYATPNITLSVNTSLLFKWQDVSGAFISNKNNGYFITATASSTMPAAASEGDTIIFALDTTQILTLTASAGQTIRVGNVVSSSGGTATSTLRGDSLTLVYRAISQSWIATSSIGTWTLA